MTEVKKEPNPSRNLAREIGVTSSLILILMQLGNEQAMALPNCNASPNTHSTPDKWEQWNCSGQILRDLSKCEGRCNTTYTPLGCKIFDESTYIYSVYCPEFPDAVDPHEKAPSGSKKCNAAPTGGAGWMQGNCAGEISHSGEMAGTAPTCTEECQTTQFEPDCKTGIFQLFNAEAAYTRWCPDLPEVGASKKAVECTVTASPTSAPVGQTVKISFSSSTAVIGTGAGMELKPNGAGTFTVTAPGENLIEFKAIDAAGNTGSCSVTVTGIKTADPEPIVQPLKPEAPTTETESTTQSEPATEAAVAEQSSLSGANVAEILLNSSTNLKKEGDTTGAVKNSLQPTPGSIGAADGTASTGENKASENFEKLKNAAGLVKPNYGSAIAQKPLEAAKDAKERNSEVKNDNNVHKTDAESSHISGGGNTKSGNSGSPTEFSVTAPAGFPTRHQASITSEKRSQDLAQLGQLLKSINSAGAIPEGDPHQASLFQRISRRYREVSKKMSLTPISK